MTAPETLYVLHFDYRSDNGASLVGPFGSRNEAFAYAATIGGTLEYEAWPITSVVDDILDTPAPGRDST